VLAIGADTLTDAVVSGYRALGVVAGSEPGSDTARGFAIAEAGITLVLERLGKAKERGARIYGEVLGYAVTSDGKGVGKWDTTGGGIERAMRIALERSGVAPEDVGAIWSAASGLRVADRAERRAIDRVFGEGADVRTPKLKLGEPIGAGGSLSAALALRSWQDGEAAKPAIVNSLSLGGTNISFVLAPFAE
jgi:3-oxoacyl-[acyl-carrier-protein] synthase II